MRGRGGHTLGASVLLHLVSLDSSLGGVGARYRVCVCVCM